MTGQRVGYIRVSSLDQTTLRQLDGIAVARVYTDHASDKDQNRPALEDISISSMTATPWSFTRWTDSPTTSSGRWACTASYQRGCAGDPRWGRPCTASGSERTRREDARHSTAITAPTSLVSDPGRRTGRVAGRGSCGGGAPSLWAD